LERLPRGARAPGREGAPKAPRAARSLPPAARRDQHRGLHGRGWHRSTTRYCTRRLARGRRRRVRYDGSIRDTRLSDALLPRASVADQQARLLGALVHAAAGHGHRRGGPGRRPDGLPRLPRGRRRPGRRPRALHTVATSAPFLTPFTLHASPDGGMLVGEYLPNRAVHVDPAGVVRRIAGRVEYTPGGFSGDGGPALRARFHRIEGLRPGAGGELYIGDA